MAEQQIKLAPWKEGCYNFRYPVPAHSSDGVILSPEKKLLVTVRGPDEDDEPNMKQISLGGLGEVGPIDQLNEPGITALTVINSADESPRDTAIREIGEEAELRPENLVVSRSSFIELGYWKWRYHWVPSLKRAIKTSHFTQNRPVSTDYYLCLKTSGEAKSTKEARVMGWVDLIPAFEEPQMFAFNGTLVFERLYQLYLLISDGLFDPNHLIYKL